MPEDAEQPESLAFVGKTISSDNMVHVQSAHDHLVKMGAKCDYAAVPPAQVAAMSGVSMAESDDSFVRACAMAEDPQHVALILDIPQWFSDAALPPEWIPYLPTPHTFKHPRYGEVVMSRERNANFVAQFNSGVYQKPIPLDGEHQTKLSGALAWIGEMRQNTDGSVDAKVQWTPRGTSLYSAGAYKYISPEFYDEWTDPATGTAHKDVAIGGALTTRPFFKASHLRPLAASEDNIHAPDEGEGGSRMSVTVPEQEIVVKDFSELERKYTEIEQKYAEVVAERDALKATSESTNERVARLEADARKKRFGELVTGWPGDPVANVARLEKVAERFGEDSDDFKDEVQERRAFAEQTKMAAKIGGSLFKEIGGGGAESVATNEGRLNAMAKERAEKKGITKEQAFAEVLDENPDLYEG